MARAENLVKRAGRLRVNRVKSDWEFWYLLQQDGSALYGLLLSRPKAQGEKGALHPEVAYGMALLAQIRPGETVLDPFAGSGAVGEAVKHFGAKPLLSDIAPKPGIAACDARDLVQIRDGSIDRIVTDPPWGIYEKRDVNALYRAAFAEFRRVLKPSGAVVLLTAAAREAETAMVEAGFAHEKTLRVLVNGKKAALTRWRPAIAQ